MNDEQFQILLGRVLDDELSPTEGDELIAWLRQNPAAGAEVRQHLHLWELFSQQVCAERSSGAFAAACRTRLLAETDERRFIRETEEKLRRSANPGIISWIAFKISKSRIGAKNRLAAGARTPRPREGRVSQRADEGVRAPVGSWKDRLREWIPHWLMSPRWALAAAVVILCVLVLPGFLRTEGVPELVSGTETQLQISRGGKSVAAEVGLRLQPNDVVRTADGGKAVISYGREATRLELEPNSELKILAWKSGKRFSLHAGKLEASVAHQRPFHPMIITTPQAEARVLGTKFSLLTTDRATQLDVTEGKVKLTRVSDGAAVKVPAGYYAIAANGTELAALPQTGGVLCEWWTSVKGKTRFSLTDDPRFPNRPDGHSEVPDFELKLSETNQFAVRLCGYVHPPVTGDYEIWLERPPADFARVGYANLLMSQNENPSETVQIAQTSAGGSLVSPYVTVGTTAESPPIPLVAGKRYYLEARLVIGRGAGQLSVVWQPPGQPREVLQSKCLSPWKPK